MADVTQTPSETSKPFIYLREVSNIVYYKESSNNSLTPSLGFSTSANNTTWLSLNVEGYQPINPQSTGPSATSQQTVSELQNQTIFQDGPYDKRLLHWPWGSSELSFTADDSVQSPVIDGFYLPQGEGDNIRVIMGQGAPDSVANTMTEFYGVPSIMNPNAYINFGANGGKRGNRNLIDRENQPKWYELSSDTTVDGDSINSTKAPTVGQIIEWSLGGKNQDKFPYRYQDFAFCKWIGKIPNNYLITLRRYSGPVLDNLEIPNEDRDAPPSNKIRPVATAVTWLGEDTENKLSSIVGPIKSALKWKPIESKIWEITGSIPGGGAGPFPGLAKPLGFLSGGISQNPSKLPPDPYANGPYANKVLGPLNVIDTVQGRDRGLEFDHKFKLIFEYSARSFGGVNTKAAMLDILSNMLMLTTSSAAFWGGMNRFRVTSGKYPFLGGNAGRAAWFANDPNAFIDAISDQFVTAARNLGDAFTNLFNDIAGGDPLSALGKLAGGAAQNWMAFKTSGNRPYLDGIHSLLTGEPTGEWHLVIGNPLNPIMTVGNLICKGITITCNDELGPDDFPTEWKFEIELEHAMPRDRNAIEAMFNKGHGRLYGIPKGSEYSKWKVSSNFVTAVDAATSPQQQEPLRSSGNDGRNGRRNHLLGDANTLTRAYNSVRGSVNRIVPIHQETSESGGRAGSRIWSSFAGYYNMGTVDRDNSTNTQ